MGTTSTAIGLNNTECIRHDGSFHTVGELELATQSWVHWFNEASLHSALDYVTPTGAHQRGGPLGARPHWLPRCERAVVYELSQCRDPDRLRASMNAHDPLDQLGTDCGVGPLSAF